MVAGAALSDVAVDGDKLIGVGRVDTKPCAMLRAMLISSKKEVERAMVLLR